MSNNTPAKFKGPRTEPRIEGPDAPRVATPQEHDAAIITALTSTKAMRDELANTRSTADSLQRELAHVKQSEQMLRDNLIQMTAKMEYHQRWNLELVTKTNDLEMFIYSELNRIIDSVNASANSAIAAVNAGGGVIKKFLDDLHSKRDGNGEYRSHHTVAPEPEPNSPRDEKLLQELAAKFAAPATVE